MTCGDAIWAAGLMSGTSLDGVDAALVRTDGRCIQAFGASRYRAYAPQEQEVLRVVLGRWPGPGLEAAAEVVQRAHLAVLDGWTPELVGFHGQTLAHDPGQGRTHQLGDGAALARAFGAPVAWDFRSRDVAMGGEGAPLAPVFHFACAQWARLSDPVVFLNLGGVGNVTWLDPLAGDPFATGAMLAFDTGPANAPLNDLMVQRRGTGFDRDGELAASGQVDEAWVQEFLARPFFDRPPPKSLDRDAFADAFGALDALTDADAAATLTALPAATVAAGLAHCPSAPARLFVTGGGRRNPEMMRALAERTGVPVDPVEAIGLDGDMLEAQAFAFLAVRVLRGLPLTGPSTTGVSAPTVGGRISQPSD